MPIMPQEFPEQPESAIASYNWTDVAEGSGMVLYYGATTNLNGTSGSILTTSTDLESEDIVLKKNSASAEFGKIYERDFDLTFNNPRIVEGKGFAGITLCAWRTPDDADFLDMNPVVVLKQVSGATTSTIVTASGSIWRSTNATNLSYGNFAINRFLIGYDVPFTHFKKDDILRINLQLWTSGAYLFGIGCDPVGRSDGVSLDVDGVRRGRVLCNTASGSSTFKVGIPFKVDL